MANVVGRETDTFLQDHPDTATRWLFLHIAEGLLDHIRPELKELRWEFTIAEDVTRKVENYNDL